MAGCCHGENADISGLREGQRRMLWMVLGVNVTMFLVEFTAGWWTGSAALLADSLDMLGDSMVYGFSLLVLDRSLRWKAVSAALKGGVMLAFGGFVLVEVGAKILWGHPPLSAPMAAVGTVALIANGACLWLLIRHRDDDVNMRSAWVCSRNDIIANAGVLLAAGAVAATGSAWPDIAVGAAIAALFLRSSVRVLADAWRSYRSAPVTEPG